MSDKMSPMAMSPDPLNGTGFNFAKRDFTEELVNIHPKLNVLDYIFKTKRKKRLNEILKTIKTLDWYHYDSDERNFKKASEDAMEKKMPRDFPKGREYHPIPFTRRDVESNYSVHFCPSPGEEHGSKSTWTIYESDKQIISTTIEEIWRGEKIDVDVIAHCCSEDYANTLFRKLRTSGPERMHYIMTGRIMEDVQREKEEASYRPSSRNRLESSEHD